VYGWIWTIVWAFWWLIVCLGAQGMTPMLGFIGFASLPFFIRLKPGFTPDMIVFACFLSWCVASAFWSEGTHSGVFTFDFETGNLAIEAPGFRLALISVVCGFAFFALTRLPEKAMARTKRAAQIGLSVLYFIAIVTTVDFIAMMANPNFGFILKFAQKVSDSQDFLQNLMRAMNLAVMTFPLFLALMPGKNRLLRLIAALIAIPAGLFLSIRLDAQAATLAIAGVTVVSLFALKFGRLTYRLLGWVTASLIMGMPLLISGILKLAGNMQTSDLPLSFTSRLESYGYVLGRIHDRWLTGWGVEASKGWKDTMKVTVNSVTVDYRIVPGHPHNMGLHVWAETGITGAVLLSAFAILLGERLYRHGADIRSSNIAGAAIWTASLVYAVLSYSLWNDAFWAAVALSASGVLLISAKSIARPQARLS
jgi:O-antigen ligase